MRLRPRDPAPASLALVAAVALHEVAEAHGGGHPIRIKWPNDLLADGAKLAGILLERAGDAVVLGFGVNLAAFPADLPARATSLLALCGTAPDPQRFLETLAASVARWLSVWRADGLQLILKHWLARSHPVGTPLAVATGKAERLEGAFAGLDDDGGLRLRLADGTIHVIRAGDVFLNE